MRDHRSWNFGLFFLLLLLVTVKVALVEVWSFPCALRFLMGVYVLDGTPKERVRSTQSKKKEENRTGFVFVQGLAALYCR